MSYETALLIIPPPSVQAFSYPIREEFDTESFGRVPAHITLLYPFVPPDLVDEAEKKLTNLCKGVAPFDVSLNSYDQFESAIYLAPDNPDPILDLYHKIIQAFPDFQAYEGEHGPELHPHLTLAKAKDPKQLEKIDLPPAPSFTFIVNKIHLYLGSPEDDIPYVPRTVIPLGGK